jgi:hypothetical protein
VAHVLRDEIPRETHCLLILAFPFMEKSKVDKEYLGIIPVGPFNEKPVTLLKEKIENLTIPYSEEEAVQFPEMTDRRNDTSHTYKEEVVQIIYGKT